MKNILTTIPKSKYPSWQAAERVCQQCDGTTDWGDGEWFWLVNTLRLPKESGPGAQCFMVYDGQIRGYFDIVDTDLTENWRTKHRIGKERKTQSIILANWHPIEPVAHTGFQGYRYTEIRP